MLETVSRSTTAMARMHASQQWALHILGILSLPAGGDDAKSKLGIRSRVNMRSMAATAYVDGVADDVGALEREYTRAKGNGQAQ